MGETETSDNLIAAVGANIQEKASLIWSVADTLRGPFKPHEYGLVILPMTVIKRFHDCLLPTHKKVQEAKRRYANIAPELREGFLKDAAGYPFYNQSAFTFEALRADPANIEDNFRDYMNGFSENVQDILSRMNFGAMVDRLADPTPLCSTRLSATSARRAQTCHPRRSNRSIWATSSRT